MANSTSIREQLAFKIGLQTFLLVGSLALTFLYTIPKLEAIGLQSAQTNSVVEKYNNMYKDGIPYSNLVSTIRSV